MAKKRQRLGPNQRKWLKALESGRYKQTTGCLERRNSGRLAGRCCLGVGCVVFGVARMVDSGGKVMFGEDHEYAEAPMQLVDSLGLSDSLGMFKSEIEVVNGAFATDLIGCNDTFKMSFKEIAALCRQHPELVFREPR